jgi:hypothetical protein
MWRVCGLGDELRSGDALSYICVREFSELKVYDCLCL